MSALHTAHVLTAVDVMVLFIFLQQGAMIGQILGTVFQSWVAISSLVYGTPPEKSGFLPTSTDMCVEASSFNSTGTSIAQHSIFTTLTATETVETTSR